MNLIVFVCGAGAACRQGLRTRRSMRMHFLLSAPSLLVAISSVHCTVVRVHVCQVSRSDLIRSAFFYSFSSETCIRVWVRAAMPAREIANRSTKKRIYTLCNYAAGCLWRPAQS